jgi:N-acetylmuramate 1-kinase
LSSDREAQRVDFLAAAGFSACRRVPLAGDASTRRYERLFAPDGASYILMDQPPSAESAPCPPDATAAERRRLGPNALERLAAGRVDAFIACADWLTAQGFSAPRVLAARPEEGLAVLEDLGDDLFARRIEAGADEGPLYDAAIDVLVRLHRITPPRRLNDWPLLAYDAVALEAAIAFLPEWLPRLRPGLVIPAEAVDQWFAFWRPIAARFEAGAAVFALRDYHAENLLWLPDRDGVARVGLLDFQDALIAHPAWDLSMLLHDARRDVSPEREAAALARYLAARPELDRAAFLADYRTLGALNIIRILGKFARLVIHFEKPRYETLMPRMWAYLDICLADPVLAPLADWLARWVPAERR